MSRSNQQLTRLIQQLVRGVQTGKIKMRWLVVCGVLAVGYFLLQPVLTKSLGVDLPGLGDVVADSTSTSEERNSRTPTDAKPPSPNTTRTAESTIDGDDLQAFLTSNTRRVYTSPAGLRYTGGSLQGHRLKHLMTHARDKPDRAGQHGVFANDDAGEIVALVDEAYLQAQTGRDTRTQREEERTVYDVNMRRRVGYIGGQSGNRRNRPAATHMRLVVEDDRLITAFPITP